MCGLVWVVAFFSDEVPFPVPVCFISKFQDRRQIPGYACSAILILGLISLVGGFSCLGEVCT